MKKGRKEKKKEGGSEEGRKGKMEGNREEEFGNTSAGFKRLNIYCNEGVSYNSTGRKEKCIAK